ncbi:hypothetical protein D2V07_10395 [Aurantiacibacter zhengii]|uniref:Uncharacterized protein n=2 Tax=Aurantiacibacter zhengii TaxID=2307003 RepID=A0A418NRX3_9SPHN|nr:hypothetical protein D2V07_10395 [Aurantiacibacter zhengii]
MSLGAVLAIAACAPMEQPGADEYDTTLANVDTDRACFFTREINGYSNAPESPRGRDRLYIATGVSERWLLETWGSCPELDFSLAVGLDARGSTSICTGQMETLVVPSAIPDTLDRCPVRVVGRVIEED